MSIENASYEHHALRSLNGNPLIEALRPAMSVKEFADALVFKPEFGEENVLDDFSRELAVELIDHTYTPAHQLYVQYTSILKNILIGYIHRNPISVEAKREQHRVASEEGYKLPAHKNLSKCISVIGLSGAGKTLANRRCLSLIPQVIRHSSYGGEHLCLDQVVYLEFQAPTTKTQKGFILNFFSAIDELLGTAYYEEWNKKSISVAVLIQAAKKVAFNHFIGIVFVDEIQRCANESSKMDYATLEFIDGFFNDVGIPMIVAGTYKVMPLYRTTMSTTRRLTSGRVYLMDGIDNDLYQEDEGRIKQLNSISFWSIFVDSFYHPNLLTESFEFDIEFKEHLHYLTFGLPALVARIMRLAYEEAIKSGEEIITSDLLSDIYNDQFKLLHPAIEHLRNGQYGGYEDTLPSDALNIDKSQLIDGFIGRNIDFVRKRTVRAERGDGLVVEVEKQTQNFIPTTDLRNLSGLSRTDLFKRISDKKC
ncbi:MAG: AAA family ATPase [Pseudomonas sp.]|uniref:AAA family ATPase n=1 Tax=Pseudomonas sp. TaxID=306 RepID=UPI003BB781EC